VKLEAPAKINLYLEVLGRREDGFHELVTVLQTIDLVDDLEVALRPKAAGTPAGVADIAFRLDRESLVGADVPADDRNLAVRAARDWLAAAGRLDSHGVDLALLKRIPSGAGLGGGSSDAAAVLTALSRPAGPGCSPSPPRSAATSPSSSWVAPRCASAVGNT
jgi:4-diphosphocytidyl-2-C-methyl-D-erythritol kinase